MENKHWSLIWNMIFGFILLLTLAMSYLFLFEKDLVKSFIESFKGIVESLWNWNLVIIFFTALLESFPIIWGFFPGQNLMLIAWWFYAQINLTWVLIVSSIWAILWNYLGYFLWVRYWEDVIKKYWLYLWIGETEMGYLRKWIQKYGPSATVLSKFHPNFRSIIPFLAWAWNMHSKKFWIYNIIWATIRAVVINLIWMYFVSNYEMIINNIWKIMTGLLIVLALYIYFFKKEEFKKYLHLKNKELDEKFWK